jgi:predicted hotdog family 3-hydroxylacyl-ACP dehydratase
MKDPQIYDLIPHREPMLLIDRVVQVAADSASAEVQISPQASFFQPGLGVPAWIGLEYMGQTAALIAGYQRQQGLTRPHLGFLLGTRQYTMNTAWFRDGDELLVECQQAAVIGEHLAQFQCTIRSVGEILATAKLSVYRKPLEQESTA